MDSMNRRELVPALSAFLALAGMECAQPAQAQQSDQALAHSEIFPLASLQGKPTANGGMSLPVTRGVLATGEYVEVHETVLPPGQMPHAPHRHTHSEFLLIREGRLEVTSEGKMGLVEAGGVVFTASRVLHSLKNVGTVPAKYFVVAIGRQQMLT